MALELHPSDPMDPVENRSLSSSSGRESGALQAAPVRKNRAERVRGVFGFLGRIKAIAFSSLLRRIVVLNLAALFILVAGIQFLNQFRAGLIDARVESLLTQGKIIAGAISASATVERNGITVDPEKLLSLEVGRPGVHVLTDIEALDFPIDPQKVAPVLQRLISPGKLRARIYDREGELILDSQFLYSGGEILRFDLPKVDAKPTPLWDRLSNLVQSWLQPSNFPLYEDNLSTAGKIYPEVAGALHGKEASVVRIREGGELVVSVAVPVQRFRAVLGVLLLSTEGSGINEIVQAERMAIFRVFLVAAIVTIFLSVVLAGTIATPLRRLAEAADNVRTTGNRSRRMLIPEFDNRSDEVGHLARSLREMTEALYNRMDAIGKFAADVSHELKNPLTSLRSAVETLPLAKTSENREKLLSIIQHDVQRLDRLITDISDASRLDAELAREQADPVCLERVAQSVVTIMREVHADCVKIELRVPDPLKHSLWVSGHEGRLGQVLNNLIDNAWSFAPKDQGRIRVILKNRAPLAELIVEDNGPGIDPAAFERIFERFYTDRPIGDQFGRNSGLGLSITKQIVEAHNGSIHAENVEVEDAAGILRRAGARFVVRLPMKTDQK